MRDDGTTEGTLLERLWATWRMEYITAIDREAEGCVFCNLSKGADGPENLIVHRGETCYVVLNLYPYNNAHAMIVPLRHVARLGELNAAERDEMLLLAALLEEALGEGLQAQGFNLGMNLGKVAGAGIPGHVHLHVVPRWLGDTNFMTVVGQTRVLPENLAETFEKVRSSIGRALEREGSGS